MNEVAFCLLCGGWTIGGLAYAWAKWKESKSYINTNDQGGRDSGDDDPRNPLRPDPTDPSDWWKHEPREKVTK